MSKSVFETLNSVNVNHMIEKKNNLTYLSWAAAWETTLKYYPEANYEIYETPNGMFYHTDGMTCWVKTGVTIEGIERIEYLPVMDFRNKSIPVNAVTSIDVNKAIQRSLTKAIARHGLGLYIYKGEDLPSEPTKEEVKAMKFVKNAKASVLKAFCKEFVIDTNALLDNLCTSFTVDKKDVKSIDNVSNEMITFFESNKQFYIDNLSLKDSV